MNKTIRLNEAQFKKMINESVRMITEEIEKRINNIPFKPTERIPIDCIQYIIDNVGDFNKRYRKALTIQGKTREPLYRADYDLFMDITDTADEWLEENGYEESTVEDIEEIFG